MPVDQLAASVCRPLCPAPVQERGQGAEQVLEVEEERGGGEEVEHRAQQQPEPHVVSSVRGDWRQSERRILQVLCFIIRLHLARMCCSAIPGHQPRWNTSCFYGTAHCPGAAGPSEQAPVHVMT